APAHPAGPVVVEKVGNAPAERVTVHLRRKGPPRVLAQEKLPHVLEPPAEVVPRPRFEHQHSYSASRQLEGHDPPGKAGTDDADLGLFGAVVSHGSSQSGRV